MKGTLYTRIIFIGILSLTMSLVVTSTAMSSTLFSTAYAQATSTGNTTTSATQHNDTLTQPGEMDLNALKELFTAIREPVSALDIKMAQLGTSDKPQDVATLAYIWGFPLVTMERQFNFMTVQMFLRV